MKGKLVCAIERSFCSGVSMASVINDTGTNLMKEGNYVVMIVEAKMSSQNKKT